MALLLENLSNVINGEVLLARLDDLFSEGIGLGGAFGAFGGGQKEGPSRVLAEVVNQDTETSRRVAKAAGGLLGGEMVDKEGAEGLVLAMGGVGGLEESLGGVS